MRSRPRLFLLPLAVLASILPAALPALANAQPKKQPNPAIDNHDAKQPRYVPFALPDDIDAQVRQRLQDAQKLAEFKTALEKLLGNPKFNLDPKMFDGVNLKDPALRKQLDDWVRKNPPEKLPPPEQWKKLKEMLDAPPAEHAEPKPPAPAAAPDVPPPPEDREGPIRDWLKDFMERAQDSKVGGALKDSQAWQKAVENLQLSIRQRPPGTGTWDLEKLARLFSPDKLKLPDGKLLDRLSNFKSANLSRWSWSPSAVSRPAIPPLNPPSIPPASSLGTVAAWLLCIALVAVLLWQASRWLKVAQRAGRMGDDGLGPWPVDPQLVSTRSELVQAFDYLALLVFGNQARAWNHQAVARSLSERGEQLDVPARQLAALYERARYTKCAEALPQADCDRARSALAQLAGGIRP